MVLGSVHSVCLQGLRVPSRYVRYMPSDLARYCEEAQVDGGYPRDAHGETTDVCDLIRHTVVRGLSCAS